MEVTTWTEALRCKRATVGRLSEPTGRNASERRAGLETVNAEADPPTLRGRLPATGDAKGLGGTNARSPPPGYGRRPASQTNAGATREALSVARTRRPGTREFGPAGWRRGPEDCGSGVMPADGSRRKGRWKLARAEQFRIGFGDSRRYMRKRSRNRGSAATR